MLDFGQNYILEGPEKWSSILSEPPLPLSIFTHYIKPPSPLGVDVLCTKSHMKNPFLADIFNCFFAVTQTDDMEFWVDVVVFFGIEWEAPGLYFDNASTNANATLAYQGESNDQLLSIRFSLQHFLAAKLSNI